MSKDSVKGLRDLPIVRDYPDLWMVITLDGYWSYLQGEALEVFAHHKVLIAKEEGDTSQVCQAYDKDYVVKADKCHHHSFLNDLCLHVAMIDQ